MLTLVYADLIINGDKRSLETARMIHERYLQEL
ncbi:type IV toxin-antitoxin system AbiEi family antitoxin [Negadavirga shengliensis]|uniref:Type IV toxin-antitoxin system AbiEi family antitoxin n=1 Tax=Negadavirga shengliensis TaxID=1389218 RepID=A0ABV9SZC4_9BACT